MESIGKNNLIGDHFFLTKQSANLMEDFAREIKKGSSFLILYGVNFVGKSRLLVELENRGIANHKFCWINFKSDIAPDATDNTTASDTDSSVDDIRELLEVAEEQDVIFADHFELASNKAKHQLFQSWATDGVDKNLNLTIATTTENFSGIRQLAQQYKIKIKSFQLMPCSMAEVEAFLSFYLFPTSPLNALSIPAEIKKQLKSSNGILGKVIEVADQQGEQITIKPDSGSESKNNTPLAAGSLLLILIVLGISYRYWQPGGEQIENLGSPAEKTVTIISDNDDVVSINQIEPDQSITMVDEGRLPDSPVNVEPKQEVLNGTEPETHIADNSPELEADNNATIEDLQVELEPVQVEPESIETNEPERLASEDKNQPLDRFQRDLANAVAWIEGLDKSRATIQIMTLASEKFDGKAYHRYLDSLVAKNIDVSGIRIYQTTLNDSVVYGVIYGNYENRSDANKNIEFLPDGLNVKQPIPRTIGGIWDEINNR